MIDFNNKLVFIHIPKTAGTSLESALLDDRRIENHNSKERNSLLQSVYKSNFCNRHHPHSSLIQHREQLGQSFSEYSVFTIVRNPYELAFSRFCYQYRYKKQCYFTPENFVNFLHVYRFPFRYDTLIPIDEEVHLDAILDFSRLKEQLHAYLLQQGIGPLKLPFANRTKQEALNYKDFYTEYSRSIVSKVFSREIIRFAWTFEGEHNGLRLWKDLSEEEQGAYQEAHSRPLLNQIKDMTSRTLSRSSAYQYSKALRRSVRSFVKGHRHKGREKVSVSLCTHPPRYPLLKFSVYSLLGQVDALYVYLNDIEKVPMWLQHPKIKAISSSDAVGDLQSSGKYFFNEEIEGYHFIADDDLIYPKNYVQRMLEGLEKYDRHCLLCCHSSILNYPLLSYYYGRMVCHYTNCLADDVRVHIASFNSVAFHTDTIRYALDDFPQKNMDDIYGSLKAHKNSLPIISLARPANWIVESLLHNNERTIFANKDIYEEAIVELLMQHSDLIFASDE